MTREVSYTIRLRDEGSDGLWAHVDELPGCFASGRSIEELQEALLEAIGMYVAESGVLPTVSVDTAAATWLLPEPSRQKFRLTA